MDCSLRGVIDFLLYAWADLRLSKASLSFRMSDHYPRCLEFLALAKPGT